jgi:hypothetical protein
MPTDSYLERHIPKCTKVSLVREKKSFHREFMMNPVSCTLIFLILVFLDKHQSRNSPDSFLSHQPESAFSNTTLVSSSNQADLDVLAQNAESNLPMSTSFNQLTTISTNKLVGMSASDT